MNSASWLRKRSPAELATSRSHITKTITVSVVPIWRLPCVPMNWASKNGEAQQSIYPRPAASERNGASRTRNSRLRLIEIWEAQSCFRPPDFSSVRFSSHLQPPPKTAVPQDDNGNSDVSELPTTFFFLNRVVTGRKLESYGDLDRC